MMRLFFDNLNFLDHDYTSSTPLLQPQALGCSRGIFFTNQCSFMNHEDFRYASNANEIPAFHH